jgi:hypothetical protein
MGGASGGGVEWEGRMGAGSRGCWAPGLQAKPLPSWWVTEAQALAQWARC